MYKVINLLPLNNVIRPTLSISSQLQLLLESHNNFLLVVSLITFTMSTTTTTTKTTAVTVTPTTPFPRLHKLKDLTWDACFAFTRQQIQENFIAALATNAVAADITTGKLAYLLLDMTHANDIDKRYVKRNPKLGCVFWLQSHIT